MVFSADFLFGVFVAERQYVHVTIVALLYAELGWENERKATQDYIYLTFCTRIDVEIPSAGEFRNLLTWVHINNGKRRKSISFNIWEICTVRFFSPSQQQRWASMIRSDAVENVTGKNALVN